MPPQPPQPPDEPRAAGRLVGGAAVVEDQDMRRALEAKGYGEDPRGGRLELANFEALYLAYVGVLTVRRGGSVLGFDDLVRAFQKADGDVLTKFLVYRDLRTRGYVAKDGFGFGSDFRVYDRGHFGEKGAKYLVFALSEGRQERIGQLQRKISQITRMGKEPIIAVIDRRGEVIYYKISGTAFPENRSRAAPG